MEERERKERKKGEGQGSGLRPGERRGSVKGGARPPALDVAGAARSRRKREMGGKREMDREEERNSRWWEMREMGAQVVVAVEGDGARRGEHGGGHGSSVEEPEKEKGIGRLQVVA